MNAVEMTIWVEKIVIRPDTTDAMQIHGIDLYPSAMPSETHQKVQLSLGISDDVPPLERKKMAAAFRVLADAISNPARGLWRAG